MDYAYGYCGMPCALCTRYRIDGSSRCSGCSEGGYYTDTCKVNHCCAEKKLKHCGNCEVFPCVRLGKMGEFSNLSTDNAKERTCNAVKQEGFEKWYEEYIKRADLLTVALNNYNDGRMKRYLCELFIKERFETLESIMKEAEGLTGDIKEKGKKFKQIVAKY